MATAHDVAAYILGQLGPTSAMKLQKLVYYSQAWSLVWDEAPLFDERIEAWAHGPVIPELYQHHRGQFVVDHWPHGDAANLSETQRESVGAVCEYYGDKTAQWLSDLTHQEDPWKDARAGLAPGDRGSKEIPKSALHEYYSGLIDADDAD